MAHNILSGSGYGRAVACSASYALPHVDSETEAARRGSAIHAYIANVLMGMSVDAALAKVPDEYRDECSRIDTETPIKWWLYDAE